ncbi:ABC transporter ATP-binding protein [Anaerolinea thermophila]|uniref:ABC transporter n=2 Tax=Anaerolinea TaxID=233189 RepID=E8N246_ANATU|nr:ABC transporter ATP-binding protein [Anaerolinea thermophila]BAJ64993.1 putative ABC transporter [Anaerolinea thermophila UNI-1]
MTTLDLLRAQLKRERTGGSPGVFWRCYGYLRPYWYLSLGAYLCMLGITLLNLVTPQLIRTIIDQGISAGNLPLLRWSVLGLLGLSLVRGVFTFLQGRWSETASQNVAADLRAEIQKKLTVLSFSYHDRSQAGDILSRAIQDVDRIRFLTGRATLRIIDAVVMMLGTAIILLFMNPSLALIAIAVMPLLAWRAIDFGVRFRPLSAQIQKQLSVLTTRVEQNLRGARVVKAFAQEEREIRHFEEENEKWYEFSRQSSRVQATGSSMLQLMANLASVFILWYGGSMVIRGTLTLGELVAFTTYLGQLLNPMRLVGMFIPAIAMAGAAAERVFEILDAIPEVQETPGAPAMPPFQGHVRFEHVSFSYGKRREVLKDISLEAQPGEIVALVGPTGSGKSTIIHLIPRFYDPTEGRITIDGVDIRTVSLRSLRSQIGIVLQETTLFAATIRENIAFGRDDASEEEIIEAAKAAQAHDFILQTPRGYDTLVGERGITLSGGQKQRIAIARAILTNPRLLVLDDATSSVDSETELAIQHALDRLMQGRTTFVIAHRLSTVMRADQILVLEKGRIVARGKHEELLASSPLYAEIYRRQLKPTHERKA